MDTDASNIEIRVPCQIQDGQDSVVAYFGKTLKKAESNYCVTRQLLATVRTLENFHKYLYGKQFYLPTENSALTWLMSFKNLEGQTARSIQRLQEYNFTPEHRQSRKHNANALSRRPCQEVGFSEAWLDSTERTEAESLPQAITTNSEV